MNNYRILTLVNLLAFVAIGISSPLLTLYLQALGADFALISVILTSVVVVALIGNYLWGRLADRLGRRKPLYIAGLLGVTLAYFWLSRAGSEEFAWAARLLDGASMAAVSTLGLTLMGDTLDTSNRRGRSMGLFRGLGSLAFAAGALMGGRLADAFSLPFAFLVCSGFFAAATLVALLLHEVKPVRAPAAPSSRSDQGHQARESAGLPMLFLVGVALWTAAHLASTTMWPNYMASFGYSKTTISSLWSLAALVEMPAMYITGALSDTMGRAIMLAAGGFSIALVQIGYMLFVQSLPALMGVQVLRGFGFGSYTSTAMTFTSEYGAQEHRGSNSGLFNAVGSAGQLGGTMMGGTLVQAFGFQMLYIVCALLAVASGVCFLLLRRATVTPLVEKPAGMD